MLLFPALLPALVGTHLAIAVADPVPNFNVEPSCRAAAEGVAGIKQDMSICLADEKGARDELTKEWSDFAAPDRAMCGRMAARGGIPTYTELLVCLQMAREAHKLSRDETYELGH
jgi:hypothetical protein